MNGINNSHGQPYAAGPAGNGAAGGPYVKDTSTAGFTKDVLEESRRQPVLVDFWAPWCGPCRQLTPLLEKAVNAAGGRVRLVKLNIDDHPSIPGQLGIQSIPAVIAFQAGRPVDAFMGAIPESQIAEFIDRIAGPQEDGAQAEIDAALVEARQLLTDGDHEKAASLFAAVVRMDPENAGAVAGIAECMIAVGQHERAGELLASLPQELQADAAVQAIAKKLEYYREARALGDPQALEKVLALNPEDHAARLKLAKILNVAGKRDEAAEHLLIIMRKDRAFEEDGARRQLVEFFDAWGFKDPATVAARRKLSSILFS